VAKNHKFPYDNKDKLILNLFIAPRITLVTDVSTYKWSPKTSYF
jgi:hypothetical protein